MGKLLENRVAVVTGAGRGIGAAIAGKFAENGAAVIIVDKNGEAAKSTTDRIAKGYGVRTKAVCLDISDTAALESAVAEMKAEFGRLEILVNNAAIHGENEKKGVMEITPEESWKECCLHARNILGADGYGRLLAELAGVREGAREAAATASESRIYPEVSEDAEWPARAAEPAPGYGVDAPGSQLSLFPSGQQNLFGDDADDVQPRRNRRR